MSPLLMIPGPIEISPAVQAAYAVPPPGHLSPPVLEAFSLSLTRLRAVFRASADSQPFVIAGSGTLAMESAAHNLVGPGEHALVVCSGYFSERMVEILRRRHAEVLTVTADPGDVPGLEAIEAAMRHAAASAPLKAVFLTHVDTSTGVRVDPEPIARLCRELDTLCVVDGVCSAGGERFEQERWGVDVFYTASQKAIGLPVGLALAVVSPRALAARRALAVDPPLYLDWETWLPIMQAYEARRPSYFATPATNMILALAVGLGEILDDALDAPRLRGVDARVERHERAAHALRKAWHALRLELVAQDVAWSANTLSALRYPAGFDATLVAEIVRRGVIVAGGLYPTIKDEYFRVGHMGFAVTQPAMLRTTVQAIGDALQARGHAVDLQAALNALSDVA